MTQQQSRTKEVWRVRRCAYHKRHKAISDLRAQGFKVVDSYLNTAGVNDSEEYTIIAKKETT